MDFSDQQQRQIVNSVDNWLSSANITWLVVGPKRTGGEETGEVALIVGVVDKKPSDALGPDDVRIPTHLTVPVTDDKGVTSQVTLPTDVVQDGVVRALALNTRERPCPGGYQISVRANATSQNYGTLAAAITLNGTFVLMSSAHVLLPGLQSPVPVTIYQPMDDGESDNILSTNIGYLQITAYGSSNQQNPEFNRYDFAWSKPPSGAVLANQVPGINVTGKTRQPKQNEYVTWLGAYTGQLQTAKITSTTGKVTLQMSSNPGLWAWFENAIALSGGVAVNGDSGSALVAVTDGAIVGLLMGIGDNTIWGCQIPAITPTSGILLEGE
jgi:hypothetical protein